MTGLPGGALFVGVRGLAGAWRVLDGFLAGSWRAQICARKWLSQGRRVFLLQGAFREGFPFRRMEGLSRGGPFAGQGFSRGRAAGGLDGHGGGFLGIIWGNRLVGTWFLRIFAVGKSVFMSIIVKAVLLLLTLFLSPLGTEQAQAARPIEQAHVADSTLAERHDKPQAVLDNAAELVRICSTRPVRVNPSPCHVPTKRIVARQQVLFNSQKTSFLQYRGPCARCSTPILVAPSCHRYVYALGRLLC